ncbi:MAG: TrmH family RNA methyltransferase [Anaerolineae bacterium]
MALQGEISSPQNRHIAQARSLHRKRARDREQSCLIEGVRLIETALDAGVVPLFCFLERGFATDERRQALEERLLAGPWPAWYVSAEAMQVASDTQTPQGVACVVPIPEPAASLPADTSLVVALDGIRDPGNLGTMLRTCHALGVSAVLLTKDCVDAWSPKVLRAGMGSHFGLPIHTDLAWDRIAALTAKLVRVVAELGAHQTAWQFDWRQPVAVLIGGEAHGASDRALRAADERVRIPMAAGAESLNAAIACGMLLYEVTRQRSTS